MSRWPLEPLMALARNRDGERMSMVELSKKLGWSETTVQGWQKRGIPSDEKAEAAAVAIGFDPANVWGEEWTQAQIAAVSVRCQACGESFVPFRRGVRYCSRRCRKRVQSRRRYWADPEKAREKGRKRYQETAEYEKAQFRRRAAENPEKERQRRKRYYEKHRDEILAKQRARRREAA